MQVVGKIRSNYALQAHRVTSTRGEGFLFMKFSMCSNLSLSRRDVDLPRRDGNFEALCHVATWICHVATSFFTCLCHVATWDSNVATWIKSTLCHVATLPSTSRRRLVKLSVTSRRDPSRRDVALV